ncbi:MAG: ABC transporter permease, partial [Flavicella sp.]
MNYELFLAKRFRATKKYKSSISTPIIKIAITAISLGMVMMLVTVATGIGLKHKIREKLSLFNGHVSIVNYDNNTSETSQFPISKEQDFYPNFTKVKGVKTVQAYAIKAGLIRTEKDFEGIVLKGVDHTYDWSRLQEYLIDGKLPKIDSVSRTHEVLISKILSERLGIQLGDKFDTYFIKNAVNKLPNRRVFNVCGIYNTGFIDFDKSYVLGDIKHIQKLNKWNTEEIGGFEIFLEDFDQIEVLGSAIYNEIDSTLNSKTILEMYPAIFEWLQLFDKNISIIIGIMILVAGINMITALLVLILERTQTIGILKSMGANNWSIRKIFLYNASYIIFKGLFIGNAIGIILLLVQKYFELVQLDPETYYVSTAPVVINLWHILLLNIGTLALCLLMLLIPSIIITKISP